MTMPNLHKMEWKAKQMVMKEIISHDGVLFGGAVRDWYIHNHNATKFYEAIKNEDNYPELVEKYSDVTFLPEFKDRMLIPNDIDATMPNGCVKGFLEALKKKGFLVVNRFKRDAKKYLPNLNVSEGQISHHCYTIQYIPSDVIGKMMTVFPTTFTTDPMVMSEIRMFAFAIMEMFKGSSKVFTLDLMVSTENVYYEPPFGNLDFECNGLLLDNSGIRLTKSLSHGWSACPFEYNKFYNQILDDILHVRAKVVHRDFLQNYRIKKMVQKGWAILNFATVQYMKAESSGKEPVYDGYCLICQDTIPEDHYKMKCCDARFHAKCLVRATNEGVAATKYTGACVMCKNTSRQPHQYGQDAALVEQICDSVSEGSDMDTEIEP